jgi:hypothetical protein
MSETKNALEVEVIIPKEVLENNEGLKKMYDEKKKSLSYVMGAETTKQLKDYISDVVKSSTSEELALFNPVFSAISFIQNFRSLKWNPEKKNEKEYTQAKTMLGKFNTAIKTTASEIKKPRNEYNKKVIQLEKLLNEESANVRAALDKNFDELLKEKLAKVEAANAKKDAVKDGQIAELSAENTKNTELLTNQKITTRKLEIDNIIAKVVIDVTGKLDSLNEEGLDKLRVEVLDKKLGDTDTPDVTFSVEEKTKYRKDFATQVLAAIKLIDDKKQNLSLTSTNANLETENKVLKANTPSAFVDDEDDMPFEITTATPITPQPIAQPVLVTDADKLSLVAQLIDETNTALINAVSTINNLEFEDPSLQSIQRKLVDVSMKNILDWTDKTNIWTAKKKEAYINHINSLQNEL